MSTSKKKVPQKDYYSIETFIEVAKIEVKDEPEHMGE